MKLQRTLTSSLALLIIASSGVALAGPEKKREHHDKDLLRGPKVRQTQPADREHTQDSMTSMTDRQAEHPLTLRDYQQAIRLLENSKSTKDLGLTQSQRDQLRKIFKEHRQAMKAFQEEHQEKIQKMRDRAKDSRQAQKRPSRDRPNLESTEQTEQRDKKAQRKDRDRETNQAERQRRSERSAQRREMKSRDRQGQNKLRNFIDSSPASKEAFAKLKALLTPDQHAMIKSHIKELRAKRAQNRQRPGDERRIRKPQDTDSPSARPRTQHRQLNKDRVNRTENKASKKGKRSKKNQPTPEDDG